MSAALLTCMSLQRDEVLISVDAYQKLIESLRFAQHVGAAVSGLILNALQQLLLDRLAMLR